MEKVQPEGNLENILSEGLKPEEKVLEDILDIYPFLTPEEASAFKDKAQEILTASSDADGDQVTTIRAVIGLLHNGHAKISPVYNRPAAVSESSKPKWEVRDRALLIDIPSWDTRIETIDTDLIAACQSSSGDYDSIVIDVRKNQGGGSGKAYNFASIFFDHDVTYGRFVKRIREDGLDDHLGIFRPQADYKPEFYSSAPIAILISGETCSSSELFIAPFKADDRAVLIGERTKGGSGNPIREEIEIRDKKYNVFIPTWRFFVAGEDKPIEETGIRPDIEYNGEDIKDFAIKMLKEKMKGN